MLHKILDLLIRQTLEEGFTAQNHPRFILILLRCSPRATLQIQRANREGNCDALTLEFIPNIGAHGVVDLVDSRMIAHVVLDLIDHGGIGKIDQKNFYLRLGQHAVGRGGRSKKGILHTIGWIFILDSNANPHRMDFRWVMEIDDRVANHLVVRDVEINGVVRTQPRGPPVNLHHFGKALAYLQPVANLIGPVKLD